MDFRSRVVTLTSAQVSAEWLVDSLLCLVVFRDASVVIQKVALLKLHPLCGLYSVLVVV